MYRWLTRFKEFFVVVIIINRPPVLYIWACMYIYTYIVETRERENRWRPTDLLMALS